MPESFDLSNIVSPESQEWQRITIDEIKALDKNSLKDSIASFEGDPSFDWLKKTIITSIITTNKFKN